MSLSSIISLPPHAAIASSQRDSLFPECIAVASDVSPLPASASGSPKSFSASRSATMHLSEESVQSSYKNHHQTSLRPAGKPRGQATKLAFLSLVVDDAAAAMQERASKNNMYCGPSHRSCSSPGSRKVHTTDADEKRNTGLTALAPQCGQYGCDSSEAPCAGMCGSHCSSLDEQRMGLPLSVALSPGVFTEVVETDVSTMAIEEEPSSSDDAIIDVDTEMMEENASPTLNLLLLRRSLDTSSVSKSSPSATDAVSSSDATSPFVFRGNWYLNSCLFKDRNTDESALCGNTSRSGASAIFSPTCTATMTNTATRTPSSGHFSQWRQHQHQQRHSSERGDLNMEQPVSVPQAAPATANIIDSPCFNSLPGESGTDNTCTSTGGECESASSAPLQRHAPLSMSSSALSVPTTTTTISTESLDVALEAVGEHRTSAQCHDDTNVILSSSTGRRGCTQDNESTLILSPCNNNHNAHAITASATCILPFKSPDNSSAQLSLSCTDKEEEDGDGRAMISISSCEGDRLAGITGAMAAITAIASPHTASSNQIFVFASGEGSSAAATADTIHSTIVLNRTRPVLDRFIAQDALAQEAKTGDDGSSDCFLNVPLPALKDPSLLSSSSMVGKGKILNERYEVISQLGSGAFSTVWLACDLQNRSGNNSVFVAVKMIRCPTSSLVPTQYEVNILKYIEMRLSATSAPSTPNTNRSPLTTLLDCFKAGDGAGSTYLAIVMPVHGSNLLAVVNQMRTKKDQARSAEDIVMVKEVIASILVGLRDLSAINILHTDIKPENVLSLVPDPKVRAMMDFYKRAHSDERCQSSPLEEDADENATDVPETISNHLVCIADFGLSEVLETPNVSTAETAAPNVRSLLAGLVSQPLFIVREAGVVHNTGGTMIQTREYRAPEVLLGMDFTCSTDVWSVGCMAFELITGEYLLNTSRCARDERQREIEHFILMMQLIGPLPQDIVDQRLHHNVYYSSRRLGVKVPVSGTRGSQHPPAYLHRFVDHTGRVVPGEIHRAKQRRDLSAELLPVFGGDTIEAAAAAGFIYSCLGGYDPKQRPSAAQMLEHAWLKDVFKRS